MRQRPEPLSNNGNRKKHFFLKKTSTLQETRSINDSINRQKLNLLLICTFDFKYLKYQKVFMI